MKLSELVVDAKVLDEEKVTEILSRYVRYDSSNGEVRFTPMATQLSNKKKLLLFLVAESARELLGNEVLQATKTTNPTAIGKMLNMKGNTLRPLLKSLKESGLVVIEKEGYRVPNQALDVVKQVIFDVKGGENK